MLTQPAELLRATRLLSMGESFLAERTATAGLALHPQNGRLYEVRGIARHYLGQHAGAVKDLESAETHVSLGPAGVWCLASAYRETDQPTRCREQLVGLLGRDDGPTSLLPRVARLLGELGEDELALHACELWEEREPGQAAAAWSLAYFLARLGREASAVRARLEQACLLAPSNEGYQAQLAIAQANAGDSAAAKEMLEKLAPTAIACPHLATRLARACEQVGDFIRSERWWDRSIELSRRPSGS